MKLPRSLGEFKYWLLCNIPMWEYACPSCHQSLGYGKKPCICPRCHEYVEAPMRVPPRLLKDKKALGKYVHENILPYLSQKEQNYLKQYFTVLFQDGFESGTILTTDTPAGAWDGIDQNSGGTIGIVADAHHGGYAAEIVAIVGGNADCWKQFVSTNNVFARAYVKFTSLALANGAVESCMFLRGNWGHSGGFDIRNNGGTYEWGVGSWEAGSTYLWNAAVPLSLSIWYCVDIQRDIDNDFTKAWVDATLLGTNALAGDLTSANEYLYVHITGGPATLIYDCIVIADIGPIGPEATRNSRIALRGWLTRI